VAARKSAVILVNPPPLPLNEPERLKPPSPLVRTADGNCASVMEPLMFEAATLLAAPAVTAVAALPAAGA